MAIQFTYIFFSYLFFFKSCNPPPTPAFWPHLNTCGILVPQPDIKPVPPAMEVQSINHWNTREVPTYIFFDDCHY